MRLTDVENMPVKYLNGRYMVRNHVDTNRRTSFFLSFHPGSTLVFYSILRVRVPLSLSFASRWHRSSSHASGMTGPSGIIRCLTSREITTFIWRCLLTRA